MGTQQVYMYVVVGPLWEHSRYGVAGPLWQHGRSVMVGTLRQHSVEGVYACE